MATYPTITNTMYGGLGAAGTAQAAANTFVPKQWMDELLVQREANFILVNLLRRLNFRGKKGDQFIIPFISNLSAVDKVPGVAVDPQVNAEGQKTILIDKHKIVPLQFDDIFMLQQNYDLRQQYMEKAGEALAKVQENDLAAAIIAALSSTYKVIGGDGKTAWSNAGAGNGSDITDAGLRRMIRTLDENKVPEKGRFLHICPAQKSALLGIDKFTLFQNIGRTKEIQTGLFGDIYGMPVYVGNNEQVVTAADGSTTYNVNFIGHKDAACTAVQMNVRIQSQYKLENTATLTCADTVYGVKALRTDDDDTTGSNHRLSHIVAFYTPKSAS